MSRIGHPRIAAIRQRLTGGDPHSVRLQVRTALGVALASYLFFFVFTKGGTIAGGESGNIIADSKHSADPAQGLMDVPPLNVQGGALVTGIDAVRRVVQGLSDSARRDQLTKLTQAEYDAFFDRLGRLSRSIANDIESKGGMKARFEVRYRAFHNVVATVLKKDISVFTGDRELVSKWQDVREDSTAVYRITYHPAAGGLDDFSDHNWYDELTDGFYPEDEFDGHLHRKYQEAIAAATKRIFDQRLTVGEYEDVLAADKFLRDAYLATEKAHETMDAFHAALKLVAKTNRIVAEAIRYKQIAPRGNPMCLGLMASFLEDYDIPTILRLGPHRPSTEVTRPMDGLIVTRNIYDPTDGWGNVDFLSNPPGFALSDGPVDDATDYYGIPNHSVRRNHRKMNLGEPDWVSREPSGNGPRSGGHKKSRRNRTRGKDRRSGGDRP